MAAAQTLRSWLEGPDQCRNQGVGATIRLVSERCPSPSTETWIFRGQGDASSPLRPKAGRPEYFLVGHPIRAKPDLPPRDICRFNEWRKQAVAYCEKLPDNDFECLAYAQHYGLATRLLDWTTNPLAALFFAVESGRPNDGAVFCYFAEYFLDPHKGKLGDTKGVARYDPRPFDRRILAQSGVFTYHGEPEIALCPAALPRGLFNERADLLRHIAPDQTNLVMLRVDAEMKEPIQSDLSDMGVTRKSLFPDLEGLSQFTNWETHKWALWQAEKADITRGALT